jgi:hypothetical protein
MLLRSVRTYSVVTALSCAFVSGLTSAGNYAKFCDRTKWDALQGATFLAEKAVASRGEGWALFISSAKT